MHYVARGLVAGEPGVLRFRIRTANGEVRGQSNPVWVEQHPRRKIYFGDLHQHTYLHDGRGTFEELYLYARRVGLLDFGALTPHVDRARLAELGFELVLFSDVASVVHHGLAAFHARLAGAESLDEIADAITPFDEFNAFVGLPQWRALEQRYVAE